MPLKPLPPGVSGERPRRGGLLPASAFFFAIPVAPASLCHSPRAPRVPPPRSVRKSESCRDARARASPRAFRPSDLAVMKVSCRTRAFPPVSRRPRVPDTRPPYPARSRKAMGSISQRVSRPPPRPPRVPRPPRISPRKAPLFGREMSFPPLPKGREALFSLRKARRDGPGRRHCQGPRFGVWCLFPEGCGRAVHVKRKEAI